MLVPRWKQSLSVQKLTTKEESPAGHTSFDSK